MGKVSFICYGVGSKSEGHYQEDKYVYGCPNKVIAKDGPSIGKWVIPNLEHYSLVRCVGCSYYTWYNNQGFYQRRGELEPSSLPKTRKTGFNANPIIVTLLILGIGWLVFRQS